MQPRLTPDSRSSCLTLPSDGIRGMWNPKSEDSRETTIKVNTNKTPTRTTKMVLCFAPLELPQAFCAVGFCSVCVHTLTLAVQTALEGRRFKWELFLPVLLSV